MGKAKKNVARLLEQGVAAVKGGQRLEAERWLRQALEIDPQNEQAWLWLSAAVEGIEAQRECLRQAVEINPHNGVARRGLAFLGQLRQGQEWRALDAPWIDVSADDLLAQPEPPDRRCARCGAVNAGWAYVCRKCAAPLRPLDVIEVAQAEERIESRLPITAGVIESWAGVWLLQADLAYAPEIEFASVGRSLTGIVTGAVLLTLVRIALALAPWVASNRLLWVRLFNVLAAGLVDGVLVLGAALAAWLLLASATFLPARLVGGRANLRVHFHLIGVAVSAWLSVATLCVVVRWVPAFVGRADLVDGVASAVAMVLMTYVVVPVLQALYVAHELDLLSTLVLILVLMLMVAAVYPVVPTEYGGLIERLYPALLLPVSP